MHPLGLKKVQKYSFWKGTTTVTAFEPFYSESELYKLLLKYLSFTASFASDEILYDVHPDKITLTICFLWWDQYEFWYPWISTISHTLRFKIAPQAWISLVIFHHHLF